MPKPVDLKIILKVLKSNGFFIVSQRGSHAKFKNSFNNKVVIVKMSKKQVPYSTFRSILMQSGLEESFFRN